MVKNLFPCTFDSLRDVQVGVLQSILGRMTPCFGWLSVTF